MDQLRSKGVYALDIESPLLRKLRMKGTWEIAEKRGLANRPAFLSLMHDLGVSPIVAEQLGHHRDKIDQASVLASNGITEFQKAQHEYSSRLRQVLAPEQFEQYKAFEGRIPAEKELESIKAFVNNSRNAQLSSQTEDILLSLIEHTKATTEPSVNGPFDPVPTPKWGSDGASNAAVEMANSIESNSKLLLKELADKGVQSSEIALLQDYYSQTIDNLRKIPATIKARNEKIKEAQKKGSDWMGPR